MWPDSIKCRKVFKEDSANAIRGCPKSMQRNWQRWATLTCRIRWTVHRVRGPSYRQVPISETENGSEFKRVHVSFRRGRRQPVFHHRNWSALQHLCNRPRLNKDKLVRHSYERDMGDMLSRERPKIRTLTHQLQASRSRERVSKETLEAVGERLHEKWTRLQDIMTSNELWELVTLYTVYTVDQTNEVGKVTEQAPNAGNVRSYGVSEPLEKRNRLPQNLSGARKPIASGPRTVRRRR